MKTLLSALLLVLATSNAQAAVSTLIICKGEQNPFHFTVNEIFGVIQGPVMLQGVFGRDEVASDIRFKVTSRPTPQNTAYPFRSIYASDAVDGSVYTLYVGKFPAESGGLASQLSVTHSGSTQTVKMNCRYAR